MKCAAVGRRFEWEVRNYLEKRGCFVLRSAGSRTVVDLIAIGWGRVMIIQCKRGGRLSPAERQELLALAEKARCRCGQSIVVPVLARRDAARQLELVRLTGGKDATRVSESDTD